LISLEVTIEKKVYLPLPVDSPYQTLSSPLASGLHQEGRRLTNQRRKVLDLFEQIGSGVHLSAEEVHGQLIKSNMRVSLATIYRTLRLLVDMGFLNELELSEGGHRFELQSHESPDHHHLICIRCGRTEEFESSQVVQAGRIASENLGFKLIESTLNVRAICPNCI
tara:strand:- start:1427 stop:1924 length:498 start_codon:yes stop_codon:yes gene_type:complete